MVIVCFKRDLTSVSSHLLSFVVVDAFKLSVVDKVTLLKLRYSHVFLVNVPFNVTYLHCLQHSLFEHLFNLY